MKKLIQSNRVRINNFIISSPSSKVKHRDLIIIDIIEENIQEIIPKKIKLDVVYEDKDILLINKPKGMVVHPGAGNYRNTLVNALLYKYKKFININGVLRPGIVHKLIKKQVGYLL